MASRTVLRLAAIAAFFSITACGGGSSSPASIVADPSPSPEASPEPSPEATPETTPMPTATPTATETPTPTETPAPSPSVTPEPSPGATPLPTPNPNAVRQNNLSCIPPEPVIEPGTTGLEQAFPNLPAVPSPIAMIQPVSDSSFWFILDRNGQIFHFDNNTNADDLTRVLDWRSRTATTLELGLTGMAFHPNYPNDNRIFLLYNDINNEDRSTLSSFNVNTQTHVIDPGSETVLLTLEQLGDNHNGGDLAFGDDGMLYTAFGDGGWWRSYSQNLTNLSGTVVRIDISTNPYTVPSDNPFNTGQARCDNDDNAVGQNCPEIWAYGFRNPWRFSFDMTTGELWVGDVGEDAAEEANRVVRGGNYGWPTMEGSACFEGNPCNTTGLAVPVAEYDNDGPQAAVGGYVYRGTQSPSLAGQYIFGDVYSNQFYTVAADAATGTAPTSAFRSGGRIVAGLAQGNDGEVYMLNLNTSSTGDSIFRITSSGSSTVTMPNNLSDTGCFNTSDKTSAQGVFDYSLNSPLWSDGAGKLRAFALPDGAEIDVLADGDFRFPENSVLIKHFLNGETYLETRLLINHSIGWQGYSYEWNEAQTDAILLSGGKTKDVGDFVHTYPSPTDCNACHQSAANTSLGIELLQLNKFYDPINDNIIDYLNNAGYLSSSHDSWTSPLAYGLEDDNASLEQRARSYLHSNCSGCHRPGAPSDFMDLRYGTDLANTNLCDVDASIDNMGVANAKRIAPGNPDASVVLLRMETTDANHRMPPLASLRVDTSATQLIRNWISSLGGCS